MTSLDEIIDRVCVDAGADFAFILTRRGRLTTHRAPQEMPVEGRRVIVGLAEELLATRRNFSHVELPREALVPFGGAAPVDVYVAARDEAIVCVVMATYIQQHRVGPAIALGLDALDTLLDSEGQRRSRRRGIKALPPKPKSSSGSKRSPSSRSPAGKSGAHAFDFDDTSNERSGRSGTAPFLSPYRPAPRPVEPPPEITIGEAPLGHATLAAIEVDAEGPEIVYGMASIGRRTVAEIERFDVPRGGPSSSVPDVRVSVASMPDLPHDELDVLDRQTLPFTENPLAAKRTFDARVHSGEDPKVTLGSTVQRTVIVGRSAQATRSGKRSTRTGEEDRAERQVEPRPLFGRDSNIEAWHQALGEVVERRDDAPPVESGSGAGVRPRTKPPSQPAAPKRRTAPPAPPKRRG